MAAQQAGAYAAPPPVHKAHLQLELLEDAERRRYEREGRAEEQRGGEQRHLAGAWRGREGS